MLESTSVYDHTWMPKFQQLRTLVEQHVAVEESELFCSAEGIITPQEAEELGITVETAKQAISRHATTTEGGTPEEM